MNTVGKKQEKRWKEPGIYGLDENLKTKTVNADARKEEKKERGKKVTGAKKKKSEKR